MIAPLYSGFSDLRAPRLTACCSATDSRRHLSAVWCIVCLCPFAFTDCTQGV